MDEQTKEKQEVEKKLVDEVLYEKFTQLKFIELSGAKLTDEQIKHLNEMEEELKVCEGKKAKVTRRCAIGAENLLLVKDVPVPESYEKIIREEKSTKFYLK